VLQVVKSEIKVDQDDLHNRLEEVRRELQKKDRLLAIRDRKIQKLEKELESIIHSKAWRAADFFRCLVRGHFLQAFPGLHQAYGPGFKRWKRKYIRSPLVRLGIMQDEYAIWMEKERHSVPRQERVESEIRQFASRPLVSLIMPVYNVSPVWLEKAVGSVKQQLYPAWELCMADDCSTDPGLRKLLQEIAASDERIHVCFLEHNEGIAGASNAALKMARGEFIGLLDHDDELSPDALLEVIRAINTHPDVDFIYSDEDKISEKGRRFHPFFKPDWSPDTLRSYNYLCHFSVIRKEVVQKVGGFRKGYDGSQDYDLFLRVADCTQNIIHIPRILYHWRAIEGSVGKRGEAKMYAYESAKKALTDHLARNGLHGEVKDGYFLGSYHIRYTLNDVPEVAIIIPTRDKVEILKRCIDSILSKTTYPNFRIYIVDNSSREESTRRYYDQLRPDHRIEILEYDRQFNFSAINNFAVQEVQSEYILFLNNDVEVIAPQWLEEMLGLGQRDDVGAVGGLLLYPDNTIQHGGIIIGVGGVAGHSHKYFPGDDYGYFGRLKTVQNLSAVTAACLLTRKEVFEEVGGFEEELSHAFNDVDLCLRIREKGYLLAYTPFARLYHHESLSRGYENTAEKRQRFNLERRYCEERWVEILEAGDPYYNVNLTLEHEDFSLRV